LKRNRHLKICNLIVGHQERNGLVDSRN
jgi:hypothetical protein